MDLYRRLSNIKQKIEINEFQSEMKDRFGELPTTTTELLDSINLRLIAEKIFCEKIILKNELMIITFSNQLNSNVFNKIIKYITNSVSEKFKIKEEKNQIKVYIKNINTINDAKKIIEKIS